MKAIIALNNLNYIGLNGRLPWKCSEDLKHFKKLTKNSTCLVGYNTSLKLPKLSERKVVIDDRDSLIEFNDKNVWCIGGSKTYLKYMKHFTEIHISYIDDDAMGDTLAPNLQLNKGCKIFRCHFKTN